MASEGYTTLVITYSKRTAGAVLEADQTRKQFEQITLDGFRFLQLTCMRSLAEWGVVSSQTVIEKRSQSRQGDRRGLK
jgi:hypothetical protein